MPNFQRPIHIKASTQSARSRQRVAVIGSGFGGLATAIRLQRAGLDVTLFEARDKPGGRAYVYESEGFTFDGGPTVITAPQLLEELFATAGKRLADYVDLLPVAPFYRLIWSDGATMDYDGDLEAQIARRSPSDLEGYRRFVEYSRKIFDAGYTKLASTPFLRFSDMMRVTPSLVRLRADRSVYSAVSRFVKDEHLREALSFHALLVGGNPFETSSIYTLIHYLERKWGVFFPRGGTGALVRAMVQLFEELGGELRLSSPVRRIEVVGSGAGAKHLVTTEQRALESFDIVVSNADVHHTHDRLYASHPAAEREARRLERMDWSMSLFVLYFGTDRIYSDVAHHTVLFGPRYAGLVRDIFHGSRLPKDFSLYLHAPSVTDPSLAPEGCQTFYVLSPVPHLGNANIDWQKQGPIYAERILESLERLLPDLRSHIRTKHFLSPDGFRDELGAYHGSAFSVAPTLRQSAWFRPHNASAQIPNLYFVGAGTHPGAGVPGVLNSAKATSSLILTDLARNDLSSPRRIDKTGSSFELSLAAALDP